MSDIILYVLALTLFQIWLLPMAVNLKNSAYLLSNRDEEVETSVTFQRHQTRRSQSSRDAANFSHPGTLINDYGGR